MDMAWLIAVLLAAMASFISNLGVTLQKLHHLRAAAANAIGVGNKSSAAGGGDDGDYSKGWMWRVGLGLVFFGSLADFAALSFGPQSLVAPLGSLTLVSNVIFAPILLKETIGHWDVLATILIVFGSSIAVIFGSHEAVTYTVFELFGFFARWDFILYAIVVASYSLVLYLAIQKIERIEREDGVHSPRYLHYRALHRFAYPSLSGTVGAQSVLFAKCVVELIANTVRNWSNSGYVEEQSLQAVVNGSDIGVNGTAAPGLAAPTTTVHYVVSQNMFLFWQSYFVIFSMLAAIFAQIKYLNDGLRRFDASYSVPVFTSFWIILSVVSGMIFYSEYQGMDSAQCMLFALGVMITVTGVITLGGREQSHAGHQSLPQHDVDGESQVELVLRDGNASVKDNEYSRGSSNGGDANGSSSGNGLNAHGRQHSEDGLDIDLDLNEDFDDVHVQPTHVHSVHVTSNGGGGGGGGGGDEESSLADGAKLVVMEASQRISQVINKLRGKNDGRHFLPGFAPASSAAPKAASSSPYANSSSSLHVPASATQHEGELELDDDLSDHEDGARRGGGGGSGSGGGANGGQAAPAAEDPLIAILRGDGRDSGDSSSSSSNGSSSSRKNQGTTPQQQQEANIAAAAAASTASILAAAAAAASSWPSLAPPPQHQHHRQSSLTPTASALYDPSPSPASALIHSTSTAAASASVAEEAAAAAAVMVEEAAFTTTSASDSTTP